MSHNHKNSGQEVPCSVFMSFNIFFFWFLYKTRQPFRYESEREENDKRNEIPNANASE